MKFQYLQDFRISPFRPKTAKFQYLQDFRLKKPRKLSMFGDQRLKPLVAGRLWDAYGDAMVAAAVEKRFGAEVARREATWFITEVHRELALHLGFIGSTSGGWPEWRKKGKLLAWMKPKSRARMRAA